MESSTSLSMEQQFQLQLLHRDVKKMNREQAQEFLMELLQQMMLKDNAIAQMFKGRSPAT
ncbi:NblA/ycf18 family protein [Synechococcus sp. PCC 7336]|uniref:NblA/ycf18 family protein n=1 Tax=Synechococcus sp. PCC 7336 TaxID=195250 RepID=UPI00037E0194|nr:NblA/ycf18 family protein [Synechococcus sp. PCC 7336]